MNKKTPLFEEHKKLGATMVDFGGWSMPVQYTNVIDEHNTTRNSAGLFDICHMGEIMVEGKQAFDLIQKIITRNISNMENGKIFLAVMCNKEGGIMDDLTVYKFNNEKYMLVVNASNDKKDCEHVKKVCEEDGFDATVKDVSPKTAKLDLQGPNSQKILQQIVDFDLNEIKYYYFKEGKINGVNGIVSRSGYTGEDGFELYFPWEKCPEVWNKLLEIGKEHSLKPVGLGARDTLRLECAMNLYGHEMDEIKKPLETRHGWLCCFDKDFIGKKALLKQKEEGVKENLVGFEMVYKGIARHGHKVFVNGKEAGAVTSGTFSPTLKKSIGLCFIDADFTDIGLEIEIKIRERLSKAKIVKLPFYKRVEAR